MDEVLHEHVCFHEAQHLNKIKTNHEGKKNHFKIKFIKS